jgi:hypothetical protein
MYFEIKEAAYQKEYKIDFVFEDGSIGTIDLHEYIDEKTVFSKFKDKNYFKSFRIEYGTIVWGDGELDIAPETLYEKATGKVINYEEEKKLVNR